METNIKRTALNITTYCNLKCKHCLAFIPYYDQKFSMSYETAKKYSKTILKLWIRWSILRLPVENLF